MKTRIKKCAVCGNDFRAHVRQRDDGAHEQELCSKECRNKRERSPEGIEARFWSHVDRSGGPDACWPWKDSVNARGYGKFGYVSELGKVVHINASRFALQLLQGPLGDMCACHHCDNPPCCNQSHLFAATNAGNAADRHAKGRDACGLDMVMPRRHVKNSPERIRAMRADREAGMMVKDIASKYGIDGGSASRILAGKAWHYV